MATINFEDIREELSHSLRNGDILTTTVRGVATVTDSFTATASQTVFTLSKTNVRNIRSLTVQSVNKYFLRDYTVNWATGVVTLNTGASLNDAVSIQFDWSASGDKIYPDMPRTDLTLTSYPRVGLEITSSDTSPFGLGGMTHITDMMITVFAWMPINKDTNVASGLGGTADLNDLLTSIRSVIRTNAKSYYTIQYIHPVANSVIIKGANNKIIQISQDFRAKFLVENG